MPKDKFIFYKGIFSQFKTTGAIAPSSRALGQAITEKVRAAERPLQVLEVGAGTGVFTKILVETLGKGDQLDICEINPEYFRFLKELSQSDESFQNYKGRLHLMPVGVEKIDGESRYDYIISGLPLNAFPPELVEDILEILIRLVKPGGWISFFEYLAVRNYRYVCPVKKERVRLKEVAKIVIDFIKKYEVEHTKVFMNVPPACARHCLIKKTEE